MVMVMVMDKVQVYVIMFKSEMNLPHTILSAKNSPLLALQNVLSSPVLCVQVSH
jgi:hypothetical protein